MGKWTELIPELADWQPDPITPAALAAFEGRYPVAIGYATLFWPAFVEVDGMVFRIEDDDKSSITRWLASLPPQQLSDQRSLEALANHLHILDFQHPGVWNDATEAQILFLGRVLRECWAAKLARDFPEKTFVVEFMAGSAGKLRDYQVTFYQSGELCEVE